MIDIETLRSLPDGAIAIGGIVGTRMDRCLENRVATQEIEPLVRPFRIRNDGPDKFRGEFWGKWFTSLVLGYTYRPSDQLAAKMRDAVAAILETQDEAGCITTYEASDQHGHWDTWSRKYVLLGLLRYHEVTGDEDALNAAEQMVDHFRTQVGPGRINLANTGHWAWEGLAPSSILEPIALLYRLTGKEPYRDLAEWIIGCWSRTSQFLPRGLRLVESACAGADARECGNPKAYEQMSCFEGLCEMYRACGEQRYLDAAVSLARNIRETELAVVGSGSNQEMWCGGAEIQTEILEQPLETCVTATWMKLCFRLLKLTGNPMWADEMELSLHNSLSAAMTPDGGWWAYYSPLIGERVASHAQFEEIGLSCCVANGPRALLLTHRWSVMQDSRGVIVNGYAPGEARFTAPGGEEITIVQETDYPVDGRIRLTVRTDAESAFSLRLRIPGWSEKSRVEVDGESFVATPGRYHEIDRTWRDGETVELSLDMRTRALRAPSGAPAFALRRGPIVLAMDDRITETGPKTMRLEADENGYVEVNARASDRAGMLLECDVPFIHHEVHIVEKSETLRMCDYASAGNRWSADNLFRVWIPRPLFMEQAFVPDTWKIIYPEMEERPEVPGGGGKN